MHATQPQGGACPEPHRDSPESAGFLAGLLTSPARFRTWLASATLTAAQPPAESPAVPDETASDGYLLTDAGRAALDAPASAARECRECGTPMVGVYAWDGPLCPDCVTVVPADNEYGYAITAADSTLSVPDSPANAGTRAQALIDADPGEAPGTAPRVLRSAALYLERYGWITGAYYDATTGVFTPPACMVGAIGMACYGGPVDAPAQHFDDPGFLDFEEAVLHLDRYLLVEDSSESYEFNDARGRTVDQVTDVLRKAAARPAHELIDALQVIDAKNADVAALAELLKPSGIWGEQVDMPASVMHTGEPHEPGMFYDCPACEAVCFCDDIVQCVHCAPEVEQSSGTGSDGGDVESDSTNFVDCQFCGAPGGYPYCQGSYGGRMSCADVVAADDAELAARARGGDA